MPDPHPERLEKTGPIGRIARIATGLLLAWVFVGFATGYVKVVHPANLALYAWALIGIFTHSMGTLLPPLQNRRLRLSVIGAVLAAATLADYVLLGDWWGPPLAISLYALALIASGVLGLELIVAGLMGYPGCESMALPNLLSRRDRPMVAT